MILESRPHFGKKRIPVRGQKVHASVSVEDRPNGLDEDREVDKIPKSVYQHCVYCDQGEKRDIHCLLSLLFMEILISFDNLEEINQIWALKRLRQSTRVCAWCLKLRYR